jgi:hypothetical protein
VNEVGDDDLCSECGARAYDWADKDDECGRCGNQDFQSTKWLKPGTFEHAEMLNMLRATGSSS